VYIQISKNNSIIYISKNYLIWEHCDSEALK